MIRRIYTYAGRDGEWSIASSPEVAAADVGIGAMPDGAIAFHEADGRVGLLWYCTSPGGYRHGGVRYVASEADAVRLVAAGGPR
jgi:hypothetical protein